MIDIAFWKDRKVLITGHSGFKGAWLSIWLDHLGAKVTGYSLPAPTNPSLFELAGIHKIIDSRIGDIRDLKLIHETMSASRPEIIFHLAAQPIVRESYIDPYNTYETNVMGTVSVLNAAAKSESVKSVINVTTDKVYENLEWCWGYRENDALGGRDPYSSSKSCSEIISEAYQKSFFDKTGKSIATARAGNVIGGGDWGADRLIPDIIRSLLSGNQIRLRNPNHIRPWQHVLNTLSGYMLLAQKLHESGNQYARSWNFGPNPKDAITVNELAEKLLSEIDETIEIEIDSNAESPHESTYLKLDCSLAHSALKWKPTWDLNTAIKKTSEWTKRYESNPGRSMTACIDQIEEFMGNFSI